MAASAHDDKELRTVAEQLARAGRCVHVDEGAQHTMLTARWHSDGTDAAGSLRVAPVAHDLAEVPWAVRIAREIVDVLPQDAAGPQTCVRPGCSSPGPGLVT